MAQKNITAKETTGTELEQINVWNVALPESENVSEN